MVIPVPTAMDIDEALSPWPTNRAPLMAASMMETKPTAVAAMSPCRPMSTDRMSALNPDAVNPVPTRAWIDKTTGPRATAGPNGSIPSVLRQWAG